MENVILIVLLILALALIGVVLLQRSEGGGLGIGGGGGGAGGGAMSGRSASNALSKLTWVLGVGFMVASLAMTVIAANNSAGSSVVDRLGVAAPAGDDSNALDVPSGAELLPPSADDIAPLAPVAE